MTTTEKLYWGDQAATTFEIAGATLSSHDGKPSIVLARTHFYPEGGGQLGDSGFLAFGAERVRVVDTQVDEAGVIHHVLESTPSASGDALADVAIKGTIDDARRRDHMAQHTAQHALSRALADEARAKTVSARLGATSCTIDVDRPGIADADLHRAEDLVNAVVTSDVAVRATFPTAEELAKMDLRKQPNAEKSAAGVRIVAIEGFDLTPCGGTHVGRSGQIGQVRIVGVEKYKGMLRITFHAGPRALADARARHDVLAKLASELTCGPFDVGGAVAKLKGELKASRERLDAARTELAELVAARRLAELPSADAHGSPQVVAMLRPGDDLAALRTLANKLTGDPRVAALCATADAETGELVVVVQRGANGKLDCGALVKTETQARGGKGGGRPERAEGRFPKGTALDALAQAAEGAIRSA